MTTWILVADSSRAKIYETNSQSDVLHELKTLNHSKSRLHEQLVSSDLPGSHAGIGGSRHHYDTETGIKEYEEIEFAEDINKELQKAKNRNQFSKLVVVSPPHFLGILRKNFHSNVANSIALEVDKNLVKMKPKEIISHLNNVL